MGVSIEVMASVISSVNVNLCEVPVALLGDRLSCVRTKRLGSVLTLVAWWWRTMGAMTRAGQMEGCLIDAMKRKMIFKPMSPRIGP